MDLKGTAPSRDGGNSENNPNESLREMMTRKKLELVKGKEPQRTSVLYDPYSNALSCEKLIKGYTALTYELEFCLKHRCQWDKNYPECPERLTAICDRLRELCLDKRCVRLPFNRRDIDDRVLSMHTRDMYFQLQQMSKSVSSLRLLEECSSDYDSIFFNKYTYEAARRSVACVLSLVEAVAKGKVYNGFAISRPPGHHAMSDEFSGYCYLNNVAIAAEMAITTKIAKKVLIFDYDIHHGQGTQQMFFNRDDVLYISIHRYEEGEFWPNLIESNFNYIGKDKGLGYNVNIPLNATGLTDNDYLAILFNIVLPIAYEFGPDLIIMSAGYDAAVGCPEGQMNVTPGFYSHLIGLLSGLANGKIAVCLEGGYFLPSLAEGVAMTLKALLGDPSPILTPTTTIHPSVISTITNVRSMLAKKWKCFKIFPMNKEPERNYSINYVYKQNDHPPYDTRNCYPTMSIEEKRIKEELIFTLRKNYYTVSRPVVYCFDKVMMKHKPTNGDERPENPQRLEKIMEIFANFTLDKRCKKIPITIRDYSDYNVHDDKYLVDVESLNLSETKDIYFNAGTNLAITAAVSGLLGIVDQIMENNATSGIAIIRPPGHHAEYDSPMGFCFVNNVAIAANYLLKQYKLEKILIIDFDVHHGNGTQNFFYNTKNVMYISVHRYDNGKFFPNSSTANYTNIGDGCAEGYNINIPLNNDKMTDTEYLAVFFNIILPIAYSYGPQFILVSAGFDAGINDPLGSYGVHPETFGHFIKLLKPLANGKIVLSLEGGYNITTLGLSVAMCTKALLNDPLPLPNNLYKRFSKHASDTIYKVCEHLKRFWPILNANQTLFRIPDSFINDSKQNTTVETVEIN